MIVLTAKERGPNDTYAFYRTYLSETESKGKNGETAAIRVKVHDQLIGDQLWVVAAIDGSLLPGYRSYYYAAIVDDLAVLVTFSASLDSGDIYDADVNRLLKSLRLYKRPGNGGTERP